jgi:hypothetical protein
LTLLCFGFVFTFSAILLTSCEWCEDWTPVTSETAFFGGVRDDFGGDFDAKGLGLPYCDGVGRRPDEGELYG